MASPPHAPHHRLLPVIVTVAAIALFSVMDALMKRAAIVSGVTAALFVRSVIGAVLLWPVWRLRGGVWPVGKVMQLHALRGVLAAGMAGTFFWGIVRTPLAESIAISFIAPLIALYLAAVLLGERIRREAVIAALFGILGVAVIAAARISDARHTATAGWGIAAILVSALLYAWNLILQRKQALLALPLDVALFQNLFAAATLLLAMPLLVLAGFPLRDLLLPPAGTLPDIAAAAVLASTALMLLAWSYARAEAQVLVPVEYTAFLWSALMGWLWFAETVTPATLAGVALILVGVWLGTRASPSLQTHEMHVPPA
ncbi:MAG: DMT family transporter [Alphaproteobacteria bacterium]|nr:DMT family transporter [Alphaproteobacteria bacterium]